MPSRSRIALTVLLAASCGAPRADAGDGRIPDPASRIPDPVRPVHVYVANESSDVVTELVWDGVTLTSLADVPVGRMPLELDGPHGLRVSPAGDAWFVSLAHGTPFGSLWKFSTA